MLSTLILATALQGPPASLDSWRQASPAQLEGWLQQLPLAQREQRLYQLIQTLGADADRHWLQGYSGYSAQVMMAHPELPNTLIPRWPIADQARAALKAQERRQWQQQWQAQLAQGQLSWQPEQGRAFARWLDGLDEQRLDQVQLLLEPAPLSTDVIAVLARRTLAERWLQALWQAPVNDSSIQVLGQLPQLLADSALATALVQAAANPQLRSLAWNLLAATDQTAPLWAALDGPDGALAAAALSRSADKAVPEQLLQRARAGHKAALLALKLGQHQAQLRQLAQQFPHNKELDPWR